jgi:uncharacterized membrane protein
MWQLLILLVLAIPIIAIAGLIVALQARDQARRLERRLADVESRLARPVPAAPVQPRPEPPPAVKPVKEPVVPEPSLPPASAVPPMPQPATAPAAPAKPVRTSEPAIGFEERFGTRWVVWVGGLALALGGIFLVSYAIEQGLIGPGVRITLAALLAVALVGAGEWARRQDNLSGFGGMPSAHIPSILTAAGTTVGYATVYAAYGLYGFLGPAAAFVLLGLVALATLAAALLHGPALAGLGLIGAYVAPMLVTTAEPNYWALYLYLAVVTAAAFALARLRMWRWLALAAVAFGLLWAFPGIEARGVDALGAHLFHAAAGFALTCALIVAGLAYGPPADPGRIDQVSSGTLGAYLFIAATLVVASLHETPALAVFTVLVAATIAVAWRTDAAVATVPAAAVLVALVMAQWAVNLSVGQLVAPSGPVAGAVPEPPLVDVGAHLALGALFAALFGGAGYLAQGRSERTIAPMLWSASAVFAPVAILVALYYRIDGFERSIPFASLALLLAALYALATEVLSKREPRPGLAAASAIFATGAVAGLALALTLALEKGWLTIALALMVPGIAWIAEKRPLPMLRWLAAVMVVVVVLRAGWEPRIVGDAVGTTPIVNWLLYGYGVPAAAFWFAAHRMRARGDGVPVRMVDAGAILFTVLLAFLEIRHLIYGGEVYRPGSTLAEVALQVCVALAMAIGLERLRHQSGSIVHDAAALILAGLSLFAIVFGLGFGENPIVTGQPVGGTFFNLILLGYGLPALLSAILALTTRGKRPQLYSTIAAVSAVALALGYLTLEVTTLYHGEVLTAGRTTDAEQYTYSAVWLGFGVVLLIAGVMLASQPVRLASAAVIALTVAKVFLVDMSDLTGVYRALSFIGLGLVLVGIGWLYQRLLFPPRRMEPGGAAPPA